MVPIIRMLRLSLNNLAMLYQAQGRYADAYTHYSKDHLAKTVVTLNLLFSPSCMARRISETAITPEQALNRELHTFFSIRIVVGGWRSRLKNSPRAIAAGTDELAQLVRHDQDLIAGDGSGSTRVHRCCLEGPQAERNQANEDRIRTRLSTK